MFKRNTTPTRPRTRVVSSLQTTPGPAEQAAAQAYFDRGSKQSIEVLHWKVVAGLMGIALCLSGLGFWQLIPLKTVEVVAVTKMDGGRLLAETAQSDWKPDQEMIAYFLNDWTASLVEISASTWRKNIEKANSKVVSVAKDQYREYLKKDANNPAVIIGENINFIRTFETISVNFIKDDVALIRFRTVSRRREGERPVYVTFAMTTNFARVKPTTQQEVLKNPSGLYITSFNITEESGSN